MAETPRLFPNRESLRAFLTSNNKTLCEQCGCCERVFDPCEQCGGDGVDGHECGEDTCCCLDPEDNEPCDFCCGRGSFNRCLGDCGDNGHHREDDDPTVTEV